MILGILYIDQLPGITFNETYAPVLAWSLLDLLLYLLHIEKCLSIVQTKWNRISLRKS